MPEQAKLIDRFLAPFRGVVLGLVLGYALFALVRDFQVHRGKVEVQVIASSARARARVFADGEFIGRLPEPAAGDPALRATMRVTGSWHEIYLVTLDGDTVRSDAVSKGHFAVVDFDSVGLHERRVAMPD